MTSLTHAFSYMPATMSLLPLVLDEADRGRYGPLMSLARFMDGQVSGQMARGMQASVICAEDADRYQAGAGDADTVMGDDLVRLFFTPCKVWPKSERRAVSAATISSASAVSSAKSGARESWWYDAAKGARPATFTQPLVSSVPALLMSGELDPVTPPAYGEAVLKGLGKGRHFVLRGQGHNVIAQGCMPKLVGQFIESTDAKALDAKCLDAIQGTPAFTSFNGWEP